MTKSRVVLVFQSYPFLLLTFSISSLLHLQMVSTLMPQKIPMLSLHNKHTSLSGSADTHSAHAINSNDYISYYYNQTLDHFNYAPQSYVTFNQKYVINSKYWGGPNSTIFAFLGDEDALGKAWETVGFLDDNAPNFKALCVYIEHRFYGDSAPFGSMKKAMEDDTTRGFLNSAQALADYAEILLHIKNKNSANSSPIIVVGGSYGGMLASWFRLKYPHIVLGALASSAPVLYFDQITPSTAYYSIVSKDFKDVSKSCYKIIQKSWAKLDEVASKSNGLAILTQTFNTCSALNEYNDLWNYLEKMYTSAAQYDSPSKYPVQKLCQGIDKNHDDILGRIRAGIVSLKGNKCTNLSTPSTETSIGWGWQRCSEMVMPIGIGENEMLEAWPFNLTKYVAYCNNTYGVMPRPNWITTFYGGHVLKNLSDSVIAVTTDKGSHCLDILLANESDPTWLIRQRMTEVQIINKWLTTYYSDLHAFKK